MGGRIIFHVDVNSAFLSWEAARRVAQGGDDIRLFPSAIGGDKERRTGIILAKSIPAKKYGVTTGEPVAMALRKCPKLELYSPDFRLYEKCSRAFMGVCREYAPVVEKYSIDECFLDMTGTEALYPDPIAIAYTIKDRIRDELGFTVNIGIGGNKLLAKMASDFEKPDKVHTLFEEEIPSKLWPLPVRELFSVGRSTAERLNRACVRTIGDLAHLTPEEAQQILGRKLGQQLHDFANGISDAPVSDQPEEAKCFSISTTLENDVTETEQAKKVLLALADSVAARLRSDGARCRCIGVTIRSNDFKDRSHQRSLEQATDITAEIYREASGLFDELWDGRTPLRLLGISLSDLTRDENEQSTLFSDDSEQRERARSLDRAVDALRIRFGADTVVLGTNYQSELKVGRKYRAQIEHGAKGSGGRR